MAGRKARGLFVATVAALVLTAAATVAAAGGSAGARASGLTLARVGYFDSPVFVDDAPGASRLLFVVEQPGTIAVLRKGHELKRKFLDLRDRVDFAGEQGLLSVAFDPGYARNRRFYVYFVNRDGNIEVDGLKRKRSDATRADLGSRRKVIEVQHPTFENHNGGQLQFGPDGLLYIGTGDGGSAGDPAGNAQNPGVLLGKLLRIDPRLGGGYTTPNDNPFAGEHGRDEIYALGLRNPYRFSFDSRTGDIFIADVGQDAWEEVDHVTAGVLGGSNFGWDLFEGNHIYDGDGTEPANYRSPAFEYSSKGGDTCAVAGGYVVHDPELAALAGRYLYADFCGGQIRSFDPADPGGSDATTGLDLDQPSSFGEGVGGRVYVASLAGGVYRLVER